MLSEMRLAVLQLYFLFLFQKMAAVSSLEELESLPIFNMETNILRTTLHSRSLAIGDPNKRGNDNILLNEKAQLHHKRENMSKRMFSEARLCTSYQQLRALGTSSRIMPVLRGTLIRLMEEGDTVPSKFLKGHSDAVAELNLWSFFLQPPFLFSELDVQPTFDSHLALGMFYQSFNLKREVRGI
jgi:hypothetical protein